MRLLLSCIDVSQNVNNVFEHRQFNESHSAASLISHGSTAFENRLIRKRSQTTIDGILTEIGLGKQLCKHGMFVRVDTFISQIRNFILQPNSNPTFTGSSIKICFNGKSTNFSQQQNWQTLPRSRF